LHALARGLGVGTAVELLESSSLFLLRRPHGATAAKLGLVEPVDVVRDPDQQIEIEGPVLAVFEGTKAVENQGLTWGLFGAKLFVEEQAVASEPVHLTLHGAVGNPELTADLAKAGSADQAMEEGFEKLGVSQPIRGREGL